MGKRLILVLGGARSGKSQLAQRLAQDLEGLVAYVATGEAGDKEMADRIRAHQIARPKGWITIEAPLDVGQAILRDGSGASVYIVDCVTLLASNALMRLADSRRWEEAQAAVIDRVQDLLDGFERSDAIWIVVSNEVGSGLVPPNPLGRAYRDALGAANQRLAEAADTVYLSVAGQPLRLKGGEEQDG